MTKRCRKCGAPVPSGASFFCNKCGAQLPAEEPDLPVCRKCGKIQVDRQSRFCDRCGAPVQAVRPVPPPIPVLQTQYCIICGVENSGEGLSFCKNCGSPLGINESRQKEASTTPYSRTVPRKADSGAALQQKPVAGAPENREIVPEHLPKAPRRGVRSYRKIAIGIAVILLIAIAVAFVLMNNSGFLAGTSENSTDPVPPGTLPLQEIQEMTTVANQGTPVFSDPSLLPRGP